MYTLQDIEDNNLEGNKTSNEFKPVSSPEFTEETSTTSPIKQEVVPYNTTQTTEGKDYSEYNNMMKDYYDSQSGKTLSEQFASMYKEPTYDYNSEKEINKRKKMALLADMVRLVTEGVGAFNGSNVQKRDQQLPYSYLENEIRTNQAKYAQNYKYWIEKRLQVLLKDAENDANARKQILDSLPTYKTSQENLAGTNYINDKKAKAEKEQLDAKLKNDAEQGALDRKSREKMNASDNYTTLQANRERIANDKKTDENKNPQIITRNADGTETVYTIPKTQYDSVVGNIYSDIKQKYDQISQKQNPTAQERQIINDISNINEFYKNNNKSQADAYILQHVTSYPDIVQRNIKNYPAEIRGISIKTQKSKSQGIPTTTKNTGGYTPKTR